jgi:hypothetical protein
MSDDGFSYVKIHSTYLEVVKRVKEHRGARWNGLMWDQWGPGKLISFKIKY